MPDEETRAIQLCDGLVTELSRPPSPEERANGWNTRNQRTWLRWVRETRDHILHGLVPAERYDVPLTLEASGIHGYGDLGERLMELGDIVDDRIMVATNQGLAEARLELEEQLQYGDEADRAATLSELQQLEAASPTHQHRNAHAPDEHQSGPDRRQRGGAE